MMEYAAETAGHEPNASRHLVHRSVPSPPISANARCGESLLTDARPARSHAHEGAVPGTVDLRATGKHIFRPPLEACH